MSADERTGERTDERTGGRAVTGWEAEPPDPDTADTPARAGRSPRREQAEILAAISLGGIGGAAARYGAGLIWPTAAGHFPWTTFWINVVGCGLMGILMVLVTERFAAHPLVRPLLGTGVLGGFTTFSTYTVDTQHLLEPQTSGTALLYLSLTLLAAVAAVWLTASLTRLVALPGRRR
jgi:CrcB protein